MGADIMTGRKKGGPTQLVLLRPEAHVHAEDERPDEEVDIEQAAKILDLPNRRAVLYLIHKYNLPCMKLSARRYRFFRSELLSWKRSRRNK